MLMSPNLSGSLGLAMTSAYEDDIPIVGILAKYHAVGSSSGPSNNSFASPGYIFSGNYSYSNGTSDPDNGEALSYGYLSFLTLQAVTQTVIICFAGFMAARAKLLTPALQKQVSALNVQLLTPALIFMKLASSLSLSALIDIALIPVLFVITTGISLMCARVLSKWMKLNLQERNFVSAMAVFGNSNSLPVSLTVSLAYTLPNLKWPELENDDQDDVASRGLLYLLIFQQLGQIVRWSWGYNTLLAKPVTKTMQQELEDEGNELDNESEARHYGILDEEAHLRSEEEAQQLLQAGAKQRKFASSSADDGIQSSTATIVTSDDSGSSSLSSSAYTFIDQQSTLGKVGKTVVSWYNAFMSFMNPPLWAMVIAIFVASVPSIKNEIFYSDGFVQHTFTKSVQQIGGMAIPMSLLVLGSNFAPNEETPPATVNYKKIVAASLLSRMVLPSMFLLPIIALSVKYINISILDDPIFLVVAFILTVAPPAIQLSQICQLNEIFEKEMAGVLFWGYVVLTLPSTIIIVVSSLEVLEWAGVTG